MVLLDEIIAYKKKEVANKKLKYVIASKAKQSQSNGIAADSSSPRNDKGSFLSFTRAMLNPKREIALIGEVKLASPSAGVLGDEGSIPARVKTYQETGMDAISVVVDRKFFHGDIRFITEIKRYASLPVLAKDFVIDVYQIHELVHAGADAVLLILKILTDAQLLSFSEELLSLGVDPVVEVQNEEELQRALLLPVKIVAVNARNLSDFTVDIARACTLMQMIPEDKIRLGFSGVHDHSDILAYKNAGAQGVLIGTSLMKTHNIEKFINSLR